MLAEFILEDAFLALRDAVRQRRRRLQRLIGPGARGGLANALREVVDTELLVFTEQHRPLQLIFQFAQVARPWIGPVSQNGTGGGGQPQERVLGVFGELGEEVLGELANLGQALAQGGHLDDQEPVHQVGSGLTSELGGFERFDVGVAVGGRDDRALEALHHGVCDPGVGPLLEESQQTIDQMREAARDVSDEAERASRETETSFELRTRDRYRKLLNKIDQALKRIDDESYGFCDETGEPIGLERLEARPIATLSIEAQERREQLERQYSDRG